MRTRTGTMATSRPQRYAKQLASHWANRGEVSEQDGSTELSWPTGQIITLTPQDGFLRVRVALTDDATTPVRGDAASGPAQLVPFSEVVAAHLERFGQRETLRVVWED